MPAARNSNPDARARSGRSRQNIQARPAAKSGHAPAMKTPMCADGANLLPLIATSPNGSPAPSTIPASHRSGTPRGSSPTRSHTGMSTIAGMP